jgi:hypothetical protein
VAQIRETYLIDGLDGQPADETVMFSLDGRHYEIDLCSEHAHQLRSTFIPFITAAHHTRPSQPNDWPPDPPAPVIPTQARNQQRNQQGSERNQAIRDWARQRHIIVSTTGRIPEQLKRVYEQEVHI